jgi:hypothetical protein
VSGSSNYPSLMVTEKFFNSLCCIYSMLTKGFSIPITVAISIKSKASKNLTNNYSHH